MKVGLASFHVYAFQHPEFLLNGSQLQRYKSVASSGISTCVCCCQPIRKLPGLYTHSAAYPCSYKGAAMASSAKVCSGCPIIGLSPRSLERISPLQGGNESLSFIMVFVSQDGRLSSSYFASTDNGRVTTCLLGRQTCESIEIIHMYLMLGG